MINSLLKTHSPQEFLCILTLEIKGKIDNYNKSKNEELIMHVHYEI